jgi:hypothetical protein
MVSKRFFFFRVDESLAVAQEKPLQGKGKQHPIRYQPGRRVFVLSTMDYGCTKYGIN